MNGKVKNFGVRQSLRNSCWRQAVGQSGSRFGAEDALEAGAGELYADQTLDIGLGFRYMDDTAAGGEILFGAARGVTGQRNTDLEVGADSHVELGDEGGAVAAKIFAGSIFLEGDSAGIAAADFERQANRNSTFRTLFRRGQTGWDHGPIPPLRRLRSDWSRPPAR